MSPNDWYCPGCNFKIFGSKDKCLKCNIYRNSENINTTIKNNDWYCLGCNFKIFGSKDKCFKCNIYRNTNTNITSTVKYNRNISSENKNINNKFRIISFNVLHIIHEINYNIKDSFVLNEYNNKEIDRLNDIIKLLKTYMDEKTVIALQEVPCDLCKLLKNQEADYIVIEYKLPRIPKCKINKTPYIDQGENIVTIIPKRLYKEDNVIIVQSEDPGKAAMIVKCNDFSIVNLHSPFKDTIRQKFLKDIFEIIYNKNYIITGDFNVEEEELKRCIDKSVLIHIDGYTRRGLESSKIDHFITNIKDLNTTTFVIYTGNLSDHNLIGLNIN